MIWPTICITIIAILVLGGVWATVSDRRKLAALAPGQRFVHSTEEANPWLGDNAVYTIIEVKGGWVRARRGESLIVERKSKEFIDYFTEIK